MVVAGPNQTDGSAEDRLDDGGVEGDPRSAEMSLDGTIISTIKWINTRNKRK